MKYTHIIWDFNGTILDDVQTGIDCVNILLAERGLKTIPDKSYYQDVFGFPIIEYYSRLGFDFEKESYHELAVKWVDLYLQRCGSAPVNPGVKETLERFKKAGIPQYILSATEHDMLLGQLKGLGLESYFEDISGLDNIHAGSKTGLGEELIKRISPKKAVLIGDTTHDYETAEKMGIDCVLYSGGHMKKSTLIQCGCRVFDDFREIWKIIEV